jgi:hypothetical protein
MLRPHLLRKLTNLFALGQEVFLTPDKRFASLESMVDATNCASARPVRNFANISMKNLVDVTGIEPVTPCLQRTGVEAKPKAMKTFDSRTVRAQSPAAGFSRGCRSLDEAETLGVPRQEVNDIEGPSGAIRGRAVEPVLCGQLQG